MKIAKKVLAVVMAVAMIAALSAMAFAADSKATVALTAGEPEDVCDIFRNDKLVKKLFFFKLKNQFGGFILLGRTPKQRFFVFN